MDKLYPLLLDHHLSMFVRYLIAALIMLICSVMQAAVQMQAGFPGYFLLLPGVFLSGLCLGRSAVIFSTVLAIVVGAYLSYKGSYGPDFLEVNGLFAITAAGTAAVAVFLRIEMRRVMQADRTKSVLLQEMAHRTKNNLAILGAMIRLEAKSGEPAIAGALEGTARRLQVTAELYDHLTLRQARLVNMRYFLSDVVEKVYQSIAPSGPITFKVQCEDLQLPNRQALALGMITNELVTNSLKYGFPNDRSGTILVELSAAAASFQLSVSDNGIGQSDKANPGGLGSRIIKLFVEELDGTLHYERLDPGLRVLVRAPVQTTPE